MSETIHIEPAYSAIEAVRDILKPWIELWGGDEWGDSMSALHSAGHTSYGLDDADCALVTEILARNVLSMPKFYEEVGEPIWGYGWGPDDGPVALANTRKESREARDYWLEGGNIKSERSKDSAKNAILALPDWMFEDVDKPTLF
jgi:hypothetical protein